MSPANMRFFLVYERTRSLPPAGNAFSSMAPEHTIVEGKRGTAIRVADFQLELHSFKPSNCGGRRSCAEEGSAGASLSFWQWRYPTLGLLPPALDPA